MTLVVSLVSFAPPCRSLSEKIFAGGLYRTVGAGGLTLGDMDTSTGVEHHIQLEMPMDHIMTQLGEAEPEAWKRAYLVRRDDQQHGSDVDFMA